MISIFFPCPLHSHHDLVAAVKSYHRSSTSIDSGSFWTIYSFKIHLSSLVDFIEIRTTEIWSLWVSAQVDIHYTTTISSENMGPIDSLLSISRDFDLCNATCNNRMILQWLVLLSFKNFDFQFFFKYYFDLVESRTLILWLISPGCWPLHLRHLRAIWNCQWPHKTVLLHESKVSPFIKFTPSFFHAVTNLIELMIDEWGTFVLRRR